MTKKISYMLLILIGICTIAYGTIVKENSNWTHTINLLSEHDIKIVWKNYERLDGEKWIEMESYAKTNGYIGVGFSPNGAMTGADIAIGWIDEKTQRQYLKDFHGVQNGVPILDLRQDYELLEASKNGDWMKIRFRRKWNTCDEKDIPITNDTMRLIWAVGNESPIYDPITNEIASLQYHGSEKRGVESTFMVDETIPFPFPDEKPELYPNVKTWDMVMNNNSIEAQLTTYFCKIVKFPFLEKKHHMIGWKPILSPETKSKVHHIVFYECIIPSAYGGTAQTFEKHTNHNGGKCYTKNMPPEWSQYCVTFLFVWVAGSKGEMMPTHVGSPLGEEHGGATYFMMEVHYDNPNLEKFVDRSGVRIFYSEDLRPNEGSVLLLGYRITPFLLIPPRQKSFHTYGLCSSECTSKTAPPTGFKVINTLVHAHLSAKKLKLRHFRNGTELPLIAKDDYYDFNYQQSKTLQNEITILPGDELVTECEYDTMKSNRMILGGLSSAQEMCQTFLVYYPRSDIMQCTSQYEFHDFFEGLGINEVEGDVLSAIRMPYNPHLLEGKDAEFEAPDDAKELEEGGEGENFYSMYDKIKITKPEKYANITVASYLKLLNWTQPESGFGKYLENYWKNKRHYAFCTGHGRKRHYLKDYIISYSTVNQPLIENNGECTSNQLSQIVLASEALTYEKSSSISSSMSQEKRLLALSSYLFFSYFYFNVNLI